LRIMQLFVVGASGWVGGGARFRKSWRFRISTLSHHLDKLKAEGLVQVAPGEHVSFRYTRPARTLCKSCCSFLYAECCNAQQGL